MTLDNFYLYKLDSKCDMEIYWDLILSDKSHLYHDSILMKHMLNFLDFTPKRLGQAASDSNGGLRYVDK